MEEYNLNKSQKQNLSKIAQALRNTFRQQIFTLLVNRNNLSFNELLQYLNISRPKLAYHLQILSEYNIITNYYDKREGSKDHSFYELSAFGRKMLLTSPFNMQQTMSINGDMKPQTAPSNFRTIKQVRYRTYEDKLLKHTSYSIEPMKEEDNEYMDPLLGCNIIKRDNKSKQTKIITLPTFKKYYSFYKHPFKSD